MQIFINIYYLFGVSGMKLKAHEETYCLHADQEMLRGQNTNHCFNPKLR